MDSLHAKESDTEKQAAVKASHPPPFPSLRSLDLDVADFWSHSLLQQPIEGNVEALFEELEKIIPRLTPMALSYDDDEDMADDSNDDHAKDNNSSIKKTEQSVALRMRMLEVWQEVLTLEFQEYSENDDNEESETTTTSSPFTQLVFPNPSVAAENISNVRNRLRVLFEKLNGGKIQGNDNDYHNLRRSLLAVEDVLDSEASLAAIINPKSPKSPKGASATKSPALSKIEWLEQLSEMMKSLTKTFLDDQAQVPDALASVASFVLQLVAARQRRESSESPPSPSPLTQDSAIADRPHDNEVSEDDIARIQRGLHNLYGRPASPFYIVQLQEDTRQLLLHWSTQDIGIPKLVQLGYLTGKRIKSVVHPSSSTNTSFETAIQGTRIDVEVQTEVVKTTNDNVTIDEKQGVSRRSPKEDATKVISSKKQGVARRGPREDATKASHSNDNDSDSETTLGDRHRKKSQGRTSEVVNQIWGSSKKARKADGQNPMNDDDNRGKKKRANISPRSQIDPPAFNAGSAARGSARRKHGSNLKPPPQYPLQKKPEPTAQKSRKKPSNPAQRNNIANLKPPPQYPSQKKTDPLPQKSNEKPSGELSSEEGKDDERKRKAIETTQVAYRRALADLTIRVETQRKSASKKRARSQEPAVSKKQASRKKQKTKSEVTDADILEAIRQGVAEYGYGNWTMIKKRSGGILKHLTGSQIKETAGTLNALSVQ